MAGVVEHGGQWLAVAVIDAQHGDPRVDRTQRILTEDDLPVGRPLPAVDADADFTLPKAQPAGHDSVAGHRHGARQQMDQVGQV